MPDILRAEALTIGFNTSQASVIAVDGINLSLEVARTLVLIGESGCGKSLTALALMRLLPHNAGVGCVSKVWFEGQDLLTLPESFMRLFRGKRLAMIFQEPMTALNPVLTIEQQLSEAISGQGFNRNALHHQMLQLLKEVELPATSDILSRYPHQLSGGQKQRIVIAMALAGNPDIMIADEPTTALDVTIQAQILALLQRLQRDRRMTLLLITHDLGVARALASHIAVMYAGQIVELASAEDFFKEVKHPYSQQLLASMPSFSHREQLLQAIPGNIPMLDDKPSGCLFHPRCAYVLEICSQISPSEVVLNNRTVCCHRYPSDSILPPDINNRKMPQPMIHSNEILMSIRDLHVAYPSRKTWFQKDKSITMAVDGISFSLKKGSTLALVGESGCGKSTTSKALLHLMPITRGEIDYRGQSVASLRGHALKSYRQKVQIIFQDPYASLNPRLTIRDSLAEGLRALGNSAPVIETKLKRLLEWVHLAKNCLDRYPHQFSGGQRQRISIARALAVEPEILICDEPTSALDVSVQAQILNLLKTLQREQGLAYLFITHNFGVVSYIADEVMVMKNGKIIEQGSVSDILYHAQHAYTQQLLAAVLT